MPTTDASALSPRAALVHRLASSLGFALVGIAPALPSDHADDLRHWLDAGKHGEMDYLARYAHIAIDPQLALPGAKAIICVADWYGGRQEGREALRHEGIEARRPQRSGFDDSALGTPHSAIPPTPNSELRTPNSELGTRNSELPLARIARYAQGDDYHWVMKDRLHELCDSLRERFPDHLFRAAVDTAPIMEREHAARAGLGWIGKHTLLIHPQIGSWFLLGEVLTTLPLETSADAGFPPPTAPPADRCGTCTRCLDACPTQCITPHSVDASRCISYLTIEHRSAIDPALHPLMGDWLAGCDVCQEVCPYNEGGELRVRGSQFGAEGQGLHPPAPSTPNSKLRTPNLAAAAAYAPRLPALPLLEVLGWSEDDRRAAFKGTALKRIKLDMVRRNALIALGNWLAGQPDDSIAGLDDVRERITAIAADDREPALVRTTAQQVLDRPRAAT